MTLLPKLIKANISIVLKLIKYQMQNIYQVAILAFLLFTISDIKFIKTIINLWLIDLFKMFIQYDSNLYYFFDLFNNYDIKINGKAVFLTIFKLMMKTSIT